MAEKRDQLLHEIVMCCLSQITAVWSFVRKVAKWFDSFQSSVSFCSLFVCHIHIHMAV